MFLNLKIKSTLFYDECLYMYIHPLSLKTKGKY